jgi:hypothetical protein
VQPSREDVNKRIDSGATPQPFLSSSYTINDKNKEDKEDKDDNIKNPHR